MSLLEHASTIYSRALENKIDEKTKILILGEYYKNGLFKECSRLADTIEIKNDSINSSVYTLKSLLEILIRDREEIGEIEKIGEDQSSIRYIKYTIKNLEEKIRAYSVMPPLLLPEAKVIISVANEEPLENVYVYSKNKGMGLIRTIDLYRKNKYKEGLAILSTLPVVPEVLLLKLQGIYNTNRIENKSNIIEVDLETERKKDTISEISKVYRQLMNIVEYELEKAKDNKVRTLELTAIKKSAERIAGLGEGTGMDRIVKAIEAGIKNIPGAGLTSINELVTHAVSDKDIKIAQHYLQVSKRFRQELEILRAEALFSKKRYDDVISVYKTIKANYKNMSENVEERLALLLLQTHWKKNTLEELDLSWFVNALSSREKRLKDLRLIDLIELIKKKQPVHPSFETSHFHWLQKMVQLEDSSRGTEEKKESIEQKSIWSVEINKPEYLNQLGCLYFQRKEIDKSKESFAEALKLCTDAPEQKIIQSNIRVLEEWISRTDPLPSTLPECIIPGGSTDKMTPIEYITSITSINTPSEVADQLQEVLEVYRRNTKKEQGAETEKIISLVFLISLLKYNRIILQPAEILSSHISVIYNYILYQYKNTQIIETEVISKVLDVFKFQYSTPAEKHISKLALFLILRQLSDKGLFSRFKSVYKSISNYITDPKDIEYIKHIEESSNAIQAAENTILNEDNLLHDKEGSSSTNHLDTQTHNSSLNITDTTTPSPQPNSITAETTQEDLSQKRDELLKLITVPEEKQPKKSKRKAKETSSTSKKGTRTNKHSQTQDTDNFDSQDNHITTKQNTEVSFEQKPLAKVKKASHTVISSDEEE
ncbi:hypothetical protein NEOKW01_0216 [Nematocida sp. AWRm80]|nr:hypothetical protein NEOKW01_0216 [Nematocida sp. AWRm80]